MLHHFSRADIDQLHQLELSSSKHPWSKNNIRGSLESSHICVGLKVENEWACYSIWRLLGKEAELLLLGTLPKYRRQNFASQLIKDFLQQYSNIEQIHLEVRESNLSARAFYENFGFAQVCTRENYYQNPTEHASLYLYQVAFCAL